MLTLPSAAEPLIVSLSIAFTEPTFKRIVPLIVGAILTTGRRTVTAVLRWTDPNKPVLVPADDSTCQTLIPAPSGTGWPSAVSSLGFTPKNGRVADPG